MPLVAVLLLAAACPTATIQLRADAPMAEPPPQYLDGKKPSVNLLARKFLVGRERPPQGFAYYCYLLFADQSREAEKARRGAAVAYMKLLRDVGEVGGLVPLAQMALLLAPMRDERSASEVIKKRSADLFLESYGYDRALVVWASLGRTGKKTPRVAIVGHRQALEVAGVIDPAEVFVVDMDADEAVSEARLIRLRDELVSGLEPSSTGEPLVLRLLRPFFAMLGKTLKQLEAELGT